MHSGVCERHYGLPDREKSDNTVEEDIGKLDASA